MGIDVMLISKEKGDNRVFFGDFSRHFCNFLCGPDAYENSEFQQIQKITGLDLSIFRSIPVNLEPDIHELEYKLYLAKEENDPTKIKLIKNEIERTKQEWEENYDSLNEGWVKVIDLQRTTKELLSKLADNGHVDEELNYNFNWDDYFEYKTRKPKDDLSFLDNTLIDDLKSLLVGLTQMSQKGVTLVTFDFG
ncbi:hypothetical protein AVL50_13045 [Flammeovirga sp. SJP92]|nr:hypothetical protein AVL50_13045 [Flammeovirga sp. SJP92]